MDRRGHRDFFADGGLTTIAVGLVVVAMDFFALFSRSGTLCRFFFSMLPPVVLFKENPENVRRNLLRKDPWVQ